MQLNPVASKHAHHGLTLQDESGTLLIRRIAVDSPGSASDLVVGDEVLAVDGRRVRCTADLKTLLQTNAEATILYARRGLVSQTSLIPDDGVDSWSLDWDPEASPVQLALRERWFEIL